MCSACTKKLGKQKTKLSNRQFVRYVNELCNLVYLRNHRIRCFAYLELLRLRGGGVPGGVSSDWGGGTKGTTNWLGTAFKPMGARARSW